MTIQLNIADAKARLSELIDRAERGEDVILARAGKPVARIVVAGAQVKRSSFFGVLAHLGPVLDDAWSPEPFDTLYDFADEDAVPLQMVAEPSAHQNPEDKP
jgi:prevent-host-death family protein